MANTLMIYTANGYTKFAGTTDGQIPVWSQLDGEWQLVTGGGGSVTLDLASTGLRFSDGTTNKTSTSFTLGTIQLLQLDATASFSPVSVGQTGWNDTEGSLETLMKGGNVRAVSGQQVYQRVYNDDITALAKGEAVYVSGAQGNRVAVKRAQANADATSATILGVAAEAISSGQTGFVITSGILKELNTDALSVGPVYLSPSVAGGLTSTKPQAPEHLVLLGYVAKVNNGSGEILIHPQNGYELDELHDVQITGTPAAGSLLIRHAADGVWKNALLQGSNITVTNADGSVTVGIPQSVATSATPQFAGLTLTEKLQLAVGTTARAGLNIGTSFGVAPSAPVEGDVWTQNTAYIFVRLGNLSQYFITSNPFNSITIQPQANISIAKTITLTGGNTTGTSINAGGVTISGGNATGATSTGGSLILRGGTGTSANGSVLIGTTQTVSVTIGATNVPLIIAGPLTVSSSQGVAGQYLKSNASSALSWADVPYDVKGIYDGAPLSNTVLMRSIENRTATVLAGNTRFACAVPGTGATTAKLEVVRVRSGVEAVIGTYQFAANAYTASQLTFNTGNAGIVDGDFILVRMTELDSGATFSTPFFTIGGRLA